MNQIYQYLWYSFDQHKLGIIIIGIVFFSRKCVGWERGEYN